MTEPEIANRVAVTGTPGTGKTAATETLVDSTTEPTSPIENVIHLNEEVTAHDLWTERDADRDTLEVDIDAVREYLGEWSGIVESHVAHHLSADRYVVLRCRPDVLEERLLNRGEHPSTALENRESEALDIILSETVERHGTDSVYEIDTTDRSIGAVAGEINAVVRGERSPSAGEFNFLDFLPETK